MLTLFEAGDLHPRIAYVLYGEPDICPECPPAD